MLARKKANVAECQFCGSKEGKIRLFKACGECSHDWGVNADLGKAIRDSVGLMLFSLPSLIGLEEMAKAYASLAERESTHERGDSPKKARYEKISKLYWQLHDALKATGMQW